MKTTPIIAALLVAVAPLSVAAKGAGNGGCPPGLAKKSPACVPPGLAKKGVTAKDWSGRDEDDRADRDDDRDNHDDYADHYHDHDHDHDADHHHVGDHVDRDRWVRLGTGDRVTLDGEEYVVVRAEDGDVLLRREDDFYRLPYPEDGSYVRIGDELLRVNETTREIVQIIQLADLLIN